MEKEIPQKVIELADGLTVKYMGKYKGKDAYRTYFPDLDLGYPDVFLVDENNSVEVITDFEALDMICEFIKEE